MIWTLIKQLIKPKGLANNKWSGNASASNDLWLSMWQHIFPHNCFNACLREQSISAWLYMAWKSNLSLSVLFCVPLLKLLLHLFLCPINSLSHRHTQKDTMTSSGRRSQDIGQCIYWLTAAHWSAQLSLFKRFPLDPITSFKLLQSIVSFSYLMEFGRGGMKTMQGASRHR